MEEILYLSLVGCDRLFLGVNWSYSIKCGLVFNNVALPYILLSWIRKMVFLYFSDN